MLCKLNCVEGIIIINPAGKKSMKTHKTKPNYKHKIPPKTHEKSKEASSYNLRCTFKKRAHLLEHSDDNEDTSMSDRKSSSLMSNSSNAGYKLIRATLRKIVLQEICRLIPKKSKCSIFDWSNIVCAPRCRISKACEKEVIPTPSFNRFSLDDCQSGSSLEYTDDEHYNEIHEKYEALERKHNLL